MHDSFVDDAKTFTAITGSQYPIDRFAYDDIRSVEANAIE